MPVAQPFPAVSRRPSRASRVGAGGRVFEKIAALANRASWLGRIFLEDVILAAFPHLNYQTEPRKMPTIVDAQRKVFDDNPAVARGFASDFVQWLADQPGESVNVSLSGGSTPKLLFEILARDFADQLDWSRLHLFWGDERCVTPEDPESNFGQCKALLLDHVPIPAKNIHRVRGEDDPVGEAVRYGKEISEQVSAGPGGYPAMDLMILGMGGDGHTASIFPHQMELLKEESICAVATHPESGQKRVSMTGPVLDASKKVAFLITGSSKTKVLAEILERSGQWETYPTSHLETAGPITIYADKAALPGK